MRVAVASDNGLIVNQHFGHAKRFLIYDVLDHVIAFVEEREVSQYCTGDTEHNYESSKLDLAYQTLQDCQYLLCTMIGPTPEYQLAQRGLRVFRTYGTIELELLNLSIIIKDGTHVSFSL